MPSSWVPSRYSLLEKEKKEIRKKENTAAPVVLPF
jgi:hypothetical protein